MRKIEKVFPNLRDAEKFHNKLYEKYNLVRIIHIPIHTQIGMYVWIVDGEIKHSNNLQS